MSDNKIVNLNPTSKKTCPPRGLEFREITDYRPSKQVYDNIYDNNMYRNYLQKNALEIMKKNQNEYTTEKCIEK